jgi:hypothetical protein
MKNARPRIIKKYALFHLRPDKRRIIKGYVLKMANETPESKFRNPSYEKNICERFTKASVRLSSDVRDDLMKSKSIKIAEMAT